MQKQYEAPRVSLIGQAEDVVMGASGGTDDLLMHSALDFEFEQDCA